MCSSLLLQQCPICLVLLTKVTQKYTAYMFVLTSPAVSHMSGSSNKVSTAVYRLCVRPYFSNSVPYVWFFKQGVHTVYCLRVRPYFSSSVPYVWFVYQVFHSSVSLKRSSLLLQQCPICLVLLTRGPQQYISYVFVLTSPAASHMSGSSNKVSTAVYRICDRPYFSSSVPYIWFF